MAFFIFLQMIEELGLTEGLFRTCGGRGTINGELLMQRFIPAHQGTRNGAAGAV
ncbi:hypothetical protein [Ralstonia solanacearum]|uniref:hypothetical protein n=1 Tax=Ralstonia solanacearum TaxID=305 RepID=UPI000AE4EC77|nr:hypothetical protein [Ralstonia solanacearum]